MGEGILYSLFGNHKRLWDELLISLTSLKRIHPGIPVCLVTNNREVPQKIKSHLQNIVLLEEDKHFFKLKVLAFLQTPFQKTIFLDLDTQVAAPITDLFEFLRIYDLAVAPDPLCDWSKEDYFVDYHNFRNLNTGVLAYRKSDAMKTFLTHWYDAFKDQPDSWFLKEPGKSDDQDWFNKLVQEDKVLNDLDLRMLILPNTLFNARPWIWKAMKDEKIANRIKVRHAHDLVNSTAAKIVKRVRYMIRAGKQKA